MKTILVTGGCGFIGANLVVDRLRRGNHVRVLDNCARPGSERNRAVLASLAGVEIVDADIRDAGAVACAVAGVDVVFHLAGQVAVTSSVIDPRHDFEVNALGTLNVLEAARAAATPPLIVNASTNKVYGALDAFGVVRRGRRYVLRRCPNGVEETAPLDFHSPYGCSKGSADQYVNDYWRIYHLPTVCFRQSCVYGPWQRGNTDQGWIAHFARRALDGEGITIYGDGRQTRDLLYVGDLIELYDRTIQRAEAVTGRVYNIGGGAAFTLSVKECIDLLAAQLGKEVVVEYGDWRPGDQRVYVSDVRRIEADLGWRPTTPPADGVAALLKWLQTEEPAMPMPLV